MATFFDAIGFMQNFGVFSIIIPFILVAALVFGVLEKLQPFGENKTSAHIVIAVALGLLFAGLAKATLFLQNFIPLIAGFFVVVILVFVILRFIGIPESDILTALKEPIGYGSIIVIILLLVFAALSQTMPESSCIYQPDLPGCAEYFATHNTMFDIVSQQTTKALTSPTILGLIFVLLVLGAATYMITRTPAKK